MDADGFRWRLALRASSHTYLILFPSLQGLMSWVLQGSGVLASGRTAAGSCRFRGRLSPEEWVYLYRPPSTVDYPRAEGVHLGLVSFEHWTWQRGL